MTEPIGTPRSATQRLLPTLNIIVKIGAVFATLFAIYQYMAAREDRRIERSFTYVARFSDHNSAVGAARVQVSEALWANASQLRRLDQVMSKLSSEDAITLRARFIEKLLQGGGETAPIRLAIVPIESFFNELQVCIDTNLCDGPAADAFFQDYVVTFWGNFGSAYIARRDLNPRYGWGVEAFYSRAILLIDGGQT